VTAARVAGRLKANGAAFVREPARMDYGRMDPVFDDTCGNLINARGLNDLAVASSSGGC
jgi:hypothetical protein